MFQVSPIPILRDNYVWCLQHSQYSGAYIVDPGQANPVIEFLESKSLTLRGVLITHSHPDHIGGLRHLRDWAAAKDKSELPIWGPKCQRIPMVNRFVSGNSNQDSAHGPSSFRLWDQHAVKVIHTPGHLPEHVSYYVDNSPGPGALFCGDVLFSAGCGRKFVGEYADLKYSLDVLKELPPESQVYCAHEYTQANLKFARHLEPSNEDLKQFECDVEKKIARTGMSLPTCIQIEKKINPFLRCDSEGIRAKIRTDKNIDCVNELETFTILRQWKDVF